MSLLSEPFLWRVRVVEEITIDAATHCLRRRSLQVAPLRSVLGDVLDAEDSEVLLALNVAPVPRGPLLDFSISGPYGDVWLLPRQEIAQRQAMYLRQLVVNAGGAVDGELYRLLVQVLGFSSSGWLFGDEGFSMADYIKDGVGVEVSFESLQEWCAIGVACKRILRPFLDDFKKYSICEEPALAIPAWFGDGITGSDTGCFDEFVATDCLRAYLRLLREMKNISMLDGPRGSAASDFLEALADYGNYYDLIAAMKVPVDEPFLVKYSERRSFSLSRFRNVGSQELVIRDALSNHVTFKLSDPNVRIVGFSALKPGKNEFAYGSFPSRSDEQTKSFYAHGADRDYRVNLRFRLALLRRLQMVPYFAAVLILLLATVLLREKTSDLKTLALVVGPAALAASVLLGREPSTLGSRLRLLSTLVLGCAVVALLGASILSYLYATFSK